ncbi:hypothetical protein [Micromonospora inositola]|uniref:Uncharacterized protein n=1 Tax=Micromonospora inositola TaxID=47865 RepID=A0A1C5K2K7_9ACTN|nr:hypothetical protein [Micromonospora inositola]SCG77050.1 hypothetical protein GA0070613_6142 [Micromonospora inositola]
MLSGTDAVIAIRAGGTAFIVEVHHPTPRVLHWGADLGGPTDGRNEELRLTAESAILNNSPDEPRVLSVWPSEYDGWSGTTAQSGNAQGYATTPRPTRPRSTAPSPATARRRCSPGCDSRPPPGQSGRVRFPGLDRTARYRVVIREELGAASRHQGRDPEWVARAAEHPIELSGAVLAGAGVPMPTLNPQQAMLIDIGRIS